MRGAARGADLGASSLTSDQTECQRARFSKDSAGANPNRYKRGRQPMGPTFPSAQADTARLTSPRASKGPAGITSRTTAARDTASCRQPPHRANGPRASVSQEGLPCRPPYQPTQEPRGSTPRHQAKARSGNSATSAPNLGRRAASPHQGEANTGQSDCFLNTQLRARLRHITRGDFSPVREGHPSESGASPRKRVPYFSEGIKVAITRHLNGDMHERGNETATVPTRRLASAQSSERA